LTVIPLKMGGGRRGGKGIGNGVNKKKQKKRKAHKSKVRVRKDTIILRKTRDIYHTVWG